MGAQVSTNVAKQKNAVVRGVKASCTAKAIGSQSVAIGSIGSDCMEFDSDEGKLACMELQNRRSKLCGPRKINITQDATVTATTYCKTAEKGIAEEISKMKNESKNGLGWGVRTSVNERERDIKSIVESKCKSNAQMTQSIDIGSFTKCADLDLYQNMDLKSQCAAEAISNVMTKNITDIHNKGAGWGSSLAGILGGGSTSSLIMMVVVIAIIGFVVLQVM